jgi:hypothetical protein
MLEEDIGNLIVALERNTEVLQKLHDLKVGDVPTIGELEQEMYDKQEVGEEKPPIKAAKPAEETPVVMDAAAVQTHLRGIASQLTDTSKLFALIQKHGGQQFSDLDSSVYEALIADAEQLVVDGV